MVVICDFTLCLGALRTVDRKCSDSKYGSNVIMEASMRRLSLLLSNQNNKEFYLQTNIQDKQTNITLTPCLMQR